MLSTIKDSVVRALNAESAKRAEWLRCARRITTILEVAAQEMERAQHPQAIGVRWAMNLIAKDGSLEDLMLLEEPGEMKEAAGEHAFDPVANVVDPFAAIGHRLPAAHLA